MRNAKDLFCTHYATEGPYKRFVFVEVVRDAKSSVPLISINRERMPAPEARDVFHSIYAVKADRVVFVLEAASVNIHGEPDVMNIINHLDVIDQVCVIDPKNPPSWYPLQEIVSPTLSEQQQSAL